MQSLNTNIALVLTNGSFKNIEKRFYAFNIPEIKAIGQLKKHFFKKWALKYKYARIYKGENIIFKAVCGIDVTNNPEADKQHYGKEISMFKLRIYTIPGVENPLPFYSDVILEDISPEKAYYDLVNRYVKGMFRKTVCVAIIYKYYGQRNEIEVARFKKDFKTGYINEFRDKTIEL